MSGNTAPPPLKAGEQLVEEDMHAAMMAKYQNYEQYPESAMRSSLGRLKLEGLPSARGGSKQGSVKSPQEAEGKRPKIILRIARK